MRRKTFDALATGTGLLVAVVLLVAGGLLMWGYAFTNSTVYNQLSSQKIHFPAANSAAIKALPAADAAAMKQYGGQLMTTGAQAETYANHFIAVHLSEVAKGKTYAEMSSQLQPPTVNTLSAAQKATITQQVDTLFKGTTLRGMLLNAYAWWQIGQIALIASIVAFSAALIMLVLSGLGLWHLRRTPPDAEVFQRQLHHTSA